MKKIKSIFKANMMSYMPSCEEVTRLKSDSMDSGLPLRQSLAIKFHMLFCQWCRKYGKQLDMIRDATRKFKAKINNIDNKPSIALSPNIKDRLKNLLKE